MFQGFLTGNLGKDPVTKAIGSGKTVCSFSVAVKGRKKDDKTGWIDVFAWEKLGELCQQYLTKGAHVAISGRMQYREYTHSQTGATVKVWKDDRGAN